MELNEKKIAALKTMSIGTKVVELIVAFLFCGATKTDILEAVSAAYDDLEKKINEYEGDPDE